MKRTCVVLLLALAPTLAAQKVNYAYDAAGRLIEAVYPNGTRMSYSYDPAGNIIRHLVVAPGTGAAPVARAAGVVNAASFAGGAVAPGEMITIFGAGIGPATFTNFAITSTGRFDNYLANTKITFDGVPAPFIYVSSMQTTVMVPYSVAGKTSTQMVITHAGRASAPINLAVSAAAPGLFSADSSGQGNGAILNQDNTVNTPENPAAKGSYIALFGTGDGQTNPAGVDGLIASKAYPKPVLPVRIAIGGIEAEVAYTGAAPGGIAGFFQMNAKIPDNVPSGAVPVVVTVGTAQSQTGLTVAVR